MFNTKEKEIKEGNKTQVDTDAIFPGRDVAEYYNFFSEQFNLYPDYNIRLYRLPPQGSKEAAVLLEVYTVPPHENDIGLKYGRGKYLANGRKYGQKDPDKRIINLDDEIWNKRKAEHDRKNLPIMGNNELDTSLNILERLTDIQTRLNNGNGNKFSGSNALTGVFKEVQEMQIGLLKSNLKERSALYGELKKLQLGGPEQQQPIPDDSQEQDSLWNHPLVTEAFETLMDHGLSWLKSTGPKKEMGRNLIQNDPNFQKLANNEKLLIALYNRCKSDEKIGQDTIDKIFNELGMQVQDIPDEEPKKEESK